MCGKFATAGAQLSSLLSCISLPCPALPRSAWLCPVLPCPALLCPVLHPLLCPVLPYLSMCCILCPSVQAKGKRTTNLPNLYTPCIHIYSASAGLRLPLRLSLSLCPAWHCAQTCHASYIMLTHTHTYIHTQLWQTSNICIRMCIYYYKSAYCLKIFPCGAKLYRASSLCRLHCNFLSGKCPTRTAVCIGRISFIALGNAQVDLFPSLQILLTIFMQICVHIKKKMT